MNTKPKKKIEKIITITPMGAVEAMQKLLPILEELENGEVPYTIDDNNREIVIKLPKYRKVTEEEVK